ncbi:AsmA family protein [Azonexus hydrophilus]|uniref:AsmA family protein n=1 Tax=Azonexus hydrophilus TaxID=418702 RepID=A0ABZ2XDP8_9RHOO
MSVMRKIAVVFAVLFALLAVAAGVVYALFDAEAIKRQIAEQVATKTGRVLTIGGEVGLSIWPELAVRAGRVSLSEADGKTDFAAIDSLRVAVAVMPLLSGRLEAREIEIDGLALTLIKRRDGSLNIDDLLAGQKEKPAGEAKPAAPESSQPLQVDIAGLALRNARFTWRDQTTGKTTQLSSIDFSTGRLQADSAAATLAIDALKLATRGSSGDDSFEFAIDMPAIRLAGQRLETPFSGNLGLVSSKLPMRSLKLPLSGKLAVDLAKSSASLGLDTRLDESKIGLQLAVEGFSPLFFNFDLKVDQLNVDRYLPPKASASAGQATPTGGEAPVAKGKADDAIDLSALNELNFRGRVAIGQLQAQGLKVSALDARIAAANGRLDISPMTARLYGGSLDGALGVNARGNVFTVRQKLADIDIRELMKDAIDKEPLEGRGSLSLDVSTRGGNADALKRALAGQAALELRDGAVRGVNVGKMLRDAKAVLKSGQAGSATASTTEKTDFAELTASFRIAGGVARNDDLAMKSPLLRLGGAGDIDIGNSRIDYLAKVSVVNTAQGQEGKELAELRGITIPIRLRGPFDKLSYSLEVGDLLKDAAKAKVEEKKQELKQKANEKLQEKLGGKLQGLFGK